MEQELTFLQFQPYPNNKAQTHFNQSKHQRRSLSEEQLRQKSQQENSQMKSLQNASSQVSQFRNFAKHYSNTIKNIIKANLFRWPLDQTTQSIGKKVIQVLEMHNHPPRKMIDAILCRYVNTEDLIKVGYEEIVNLFTISQIASSCQKIRALLFSQINNQDKNPMIGRRISNSKLFVEYLKEVTRVYQTKDRFSFRLRPEEIRNIRRKVQQKEFERKRAQQENKYYEKFAYPESNFLDCI